MSPAPDTGRDQVITRDDDGNTRWTTWHVQLPGRQRESELRPGTEFTYLEPGLTRRRVVFHETIARPGRAQPVIVAYTIGLPHDPLTRHDVDPAWVTHIHRNTSI